jgi:UDP-3-O-[3-hydroxymyristoyl] N-acetylglucosamine deacetylase
MFEQTIKKRVDVTGIGLHSGEPIKLVLEPAPQGSGITFIHAYSGTKIKLHPDNITETKLATTLGQRPNSISTIEHFLSAVYAYGIDNLNVYVYGNEMPIMDGSAIPFCMLLDEAEVTSQNRAKSFMVITKEISIKEGDKFVSIKPSMKAVFDFEINFNHPVIGQERVRFEFTKKSFIEEIARARTFGFARDIQYLQSMNLALGASLDNAIGLDEVSVLNPEGLRFEDEFVRHKILDAMGDIAVLGYSVLGEYRAYAGSHELNHKLTKKILASRDSYKILSFDKIKERELVKVFA